MLRILKVALYTVDGSEIRRSPPVTYETLWKMGYSPYQQVQDFFHQQYAVVFEALANVTQQLYGRPVIFFETWIVDKQKQYLLSWKVL